MRKDNQKNNGNHPNNTPQWKKAVVTWIGIFPLITTLSYALSDLTANQPIFVRTLFVTAMAVPLMIYIIIPRLNKILNKWLTPKEISVFKKIVLICTSNKFVSKSF
ncbi:MAG: hypothetical protein DA328_06795 [Nitrososphaeraceae archaeon]|nr:hypothetical protein [Nitrososphaeraceae archaeon]